jgi:hypothetical protein
MGLSLHGSISPIMSQCVKNRSHFSPGRRRKYVSPKRRHRPTHKHGAKPPPKNKKYNNNGRENLKSQKWKFSWTLNIKQKTLRNIKIRSANIFQICPFLFGAGVAQCNVWIQTRPVFDPRQRQRMFPLTSVSRPALRPTQPPVQWVPGALSLGGKEQPGRDADHSPHLMPKSRMSKGYIPGSTPWRLHGVAGQLFFRTYLAHVFNCDVNFFHVYNCSHNENKCTLSQKVFIIAILCSSVHSV